MQTFQDKVAVVTGGASGIGLGMCRAFASRGMRLVIADMDEAGLDAAVGEFEAAGVSAVGVRCDVSKLEEVERLAERTMTEHGAVPQGVDWNGPESYVKLS